MSRMNKTQKKRFYCILSISVLLLLIALVSVSCLVVTFKSYAISHKNEREKSEEAEELKAALDNPGKQKKDPPEEQDEELPENQKQMDEPEEEQPEKEAVTDCSVKLTDIYAEKGNTVVFKCFDADAECYEWEYYDMTSKDWMPISDSAEIYEDELHRKISGLKVKAEDENQGLMVRCILHFPTKEDQIQEASLHVLEKKINNMMIEDLTVDANLYLSAAELPVNVTYLDGSEEVIRGLYGIYFISTQEEKEENRSISGNRIETTTFITTECDYLYSAQEEQSVQIRYHPETMENGMIETSCTITGRDQQAPIISELTISPYEKSNIDKPVTLTVSIAAEDDITPYPELEYAFLYTEQEPVEEDWIRKSSFDVSIERNGTYTAYVRDEAGNVSTMDKQLITVDNKAPMISSVTLTNESWCRSNTIIVDARDGGSMSYRFKCEVDGVDSDWITYSEYEVKKNGTWLIQVKDDADNLSETEVIVSNIDREAPVIKSIDIKR